MEQFLQFLSEEPLILGLFSLLIGIAVASFITLIHSIFFYCREDSYYSDGPYG